MEFQALGFFPRSLLLCTLAFEFRWQGGTAYTDPSVEAGGVLAPKNKRFSRAKQRNRTHR